MAPTSTEQAKRRRIDPWVLLYKWMSAKALCKQPAKAVAAVSIEELRAELARREAVEED